VRRLTDEIVRELTGPGSVRRFVGDVRFGLRLCARTPVLTATVVLSLALGIGATTAVFSVVQAVLARPLPFAEPDRLVAIWDRHVREPGMAKVFASFQDFDTWSRHSGSFERMAALTWATGEQILTGKGPARVVLAIPTTDGMFPLLGVRAALGRTFQPDDRRRGCAVVVAHHFWRDTLGGRPDAVGDSLTLDERACTIVGVMPPDFRFLPAATDMWRLIPQQPDPVRDGLANGVGVFGRLRPGIDREAAQAELMALHARAGNDEMHQRSFGPSVNELQQELTWLAGRNLRFTLIVLFLAVGAVLLIACINVANLLLSRSSARQREFAVRAALGSGRVRLLRQLLTEGLLLATAGAALGTLIATGGVHAFRAADPVELPVGAQVTLDLPVFAFAASLAVLTALGFGLAPAWCAARADVTALLKSGGRGSTAQPMSGRLGKVLVIAEVTWSVVLLVGGALMIESVGRLGNTPLGFDRRDLTTLDVRLPASRYGSPASRASFYEQLLKDVQHLPGSAGSALATGFLRGRGGNVLAVRGRPQPSPDAAAPDVAHESISADYFHVMAVPLLAGRWFDAGDRDRTEPVAIVNEALARKYFAAEPVVGRYVRYGSDPEAPWLRIVGVAGNQKTTNVNQEMNWVERPFLFRPIQQTAPSQATLIVRAPASVGDLGRAVPALIAALDRDVPVSDLQTVESRIARTMAYPAFRARLLGGFAAVALLLAVAGLYGVLSQQVAQRTQEIGIRVALGAQRSAVFALVAKQGAFLAGSGLAAGLAVALWFGRFLGSLLYGIRPTDPALLALVSVVLASAAVVASWLPARRALRIDPIIALRQD
jgi:putative ABC transport system permease protein